MPRLEKTLLTYVICCDDEEDEWFLFKRAVSKVVPANVDIHWAQGGEELFKVLEGLPDTTCAVCFLDINMPRDSGLEVLRKLKADPRYRQSPTIVMLTVSGDVRDVAEAYKLGCTLYLRKSGDLKTFEEDLSHTLSIADALIDLRNDK